MVVQELAVVGVLQVTALWCELLDLVEQEDRVQSQLHSLDRSHPAEQVHGVESDPVLDRLLVRAGASGPADLIALWLTAATTSTKD